MNLGTLPICVQRVIEGGLAEPRLVEIIRKVVQILPDGPKFASVAAADQKD